MDSRERGFYFENLYRIKTLNPEELDKIIILLSHSRKFSHLKSPVIEEQEYCEEFFLRMLFNDKVSSLHDLEKKFLNEYARYTYMVKMMLKPVYEAVYYNQLMNHLEKSIKYAQRLLPVGRSNTADDMNTKSSVPLAARHPHKPSLKEKLFGTVYGVKQRNQAGFYTQHLPTGE